MASKKKTTRTTHKMSHLQSNAFAIRIGENECEK